MKTPEPSKPPKRRRRWRQYSISTLLAAVTLVSAILGMVVVPAERQRRAVAAIHELRGSVGVGYDGTPGEPPGPDWLCRILGMDYFADVVHVDVVHVEASDMTDATWSHLSALRELQYLYLFGTEVTDAGLAHLAGLKNLKDLYLYNTQVTDAGLAHLAGLTSLERLDLTGTQVTDVGLAHLAGLTSLERLDLDDTQVSDAGLARLAGLTSLQSLWLNGTQVTDVGRDKLRQALPKYCYVQH